MRGPDGLLRTGVNAAWLRHGDTAVLALQTVDTLGGAEPGSRSELEAPAIG